MPQNVKIMWVFSDLSESFITLLLGLAAVTLA